MFPPFLHPGDEIRLVSPSGKIDPEYIDGAKQKLREWGLNPTEGQYARSACGRYAGTVRQRTDDLQSALDDNNVKAVLCTRGGYGLMQIIDKIDFSSFIRNPKWFIGFSDVTVLHGAIAALGISSLHAIMAKHLTELPSESESVSELKNILFGQLPVYNTPSHLLNIPGVAGGRLIGGNMAVLMGLRYTPFDYSYDNAILFIEDIGEEPYKIDRMMQNLRLSGILSRISALIVGQFNEMEEDLSLDSGVYDSLCEILKPYNIPVCFGFPTGHVDYNLPLIVNAGVRLEVSEEGVVLSYNEKIDRKKSF